MLWQNELNCNYVKSPENIESCRTSISLCDFQIDLFLDDVAFKIVCGNNSSTLCSQPSLLEILFATENTFYWKFDLGQIMFVVDMLLISILGKSANMLILRK